MLKNMFTKYLCLASLFFVGVVAASATYAGARSIFVGEPTEDQCRNCHDNLTQFPMLLHRNPDRHHLLVGELIPPLSQSKAPDAPAVAPGEPYQCTSCHTFTFNPSTGASVLDPEFRDCLQCHPVWRVTGSPMGGSGNNVHHETATFAARNCSVCHNNGGYMGGDGGGGGGGGRMGRW